MAFNKFTGEEIWQSESMKDQRSYVSPIVYELNNKKILLAVTARHLVALSPENGEVKWSFNYFNVKEWVHQPGLIWANTPVFKGNEIYITKGYDHPGVMLTVADNGLSAKEKYQSNVLDNHHHGLVLHDGFLYGSNWESNAKGYWVCMDWDTGEIQFEHDWFNKGSIVFADGMLYIYEERKGNLGLVRPNPEKFDLVSSFQVKEGTGPHWAHPFIKNKVLYIRHGDVLMAFDIAKK